MNTVITYRKTPHATVNTIYGTVGTDLVHAWCFENGNKEDKIIKKWISKSQCYVKAGLQDLQDYAFTSSDIRKYHVDVWNEKAKNYKRHGKFSTNYELKQNSENSTLENLFGVIL
jgi:hypothetical protein